MKFFTTLSVSVLIAFIICSVMPVNGEEQIYTDMIRLHVLAASDEEDEQQLKLAVRDALLNKVKIITDGVTDTNEALEIIKANMDELCAIGQSVVDVSGKSHRVTAEIGQERYPERVYEGFTLPAGEYCSLRIKIGAAEGKNWWCVLFPPLCTAAAEDREQVFLAAGFTEEQYRTVTETENVKYKVKFKLLEVIRELFEHGK